MSFVVVIQRTELTCDIYGPYRSFKAADRDARVWSGTVEPINKPSEHWFDKGPSDEQYEAALGPCNK